MGTVLLVFFFLTEINCRYLPDKSNTVNATKSEHVEEIQHAICKIATEEIQASANASITRQLKGVCSTKAMNSRIDELQRIIITEIETFKLMLVSAGYTTPKPSVTLPIETKSPDTYEEYDYVYDFDNNNNNQINVFKSLEYSNRTQTVQHNKSTPTIDQKRKYGVEGYPREYEVKDNNETIQETDMGRAFVYFWRITDFVNILDDDIELMSSPIEYLDHSMFVRLSTKHLGSDYISLELLTSDKFTKPFRFIFMHGETKNDFHSPLLGNSVPASKLFRIARDKIRTFIISGALLIKVLVYMDL